MVLLKIDGMTCGHCVAAIRKAVLSVDPSAGVEVDLASGIARITGESAPARLIDAIETEGYKVTPGEAR